MQQQNAAPLTRHYSVMHGCAPANYIQLKGHRGNMTALGNGEELTVVDAAAAAG